MQGDPLGAAEPTPGGLGHWAVQAPRLKAQGQGARGAEPAPADRFSRRAETQRRLLEARTWRQSSQNRLAE